MCLWIQPTVRANYCITLLDSDGWLITLLNRIIRSPLICDSSWYDSIKHNDSFCLAIFQTTSRNSTACSSGFERIFHVPLQLGLQLFGRRVMNYSKDHFNVKRTLYW